MITRATAQQVRLLQPDLLYVPSAELLPSLIPAIAVGRMRNIPVVACAQTVVSWRPKPKYDAQQRLTRRLLARAAATIVVAPSVARAMQTEGFSGRIDVGLNGVDRAPMRGRINPRRSLLFLSRTIPA